MKHSLKELGKHKLFIDAAIEAGHKLYEGNGFVKTEKCKKPENSNTWKMVREPPNK